LIEIRTRHAPVRVDELPASWIVDLCGALA
jgi:hypothetical protein